MFDMLKSSKNNLVFFILSAFFLFSLFNPIFKKFDYGAGYPLVLLFGLIVAFFTLLEFKEKREKCTMDRVFLLIFVVFVFLSFVFSQTQNVGFNEVIAFISVSVFYLIYSNRKIEWMQRFIDIVVIAAVISVILAYFLYIFRPEVRFIGPFFNTLYHSHVWPNAFALFLLMVWPLMLLMPKKRTGWKIAVLLGFIISGLVLTYSRGAMIAFAGQFVLLVIFFRKKINFKVFLYFLLALTVLGALFWNTNLIKAQRHEVIDVSARVKFENSESLTSLQERVDFWYGATYLATEKPVFGWGPYSFRYAYNPIQKTFLGTSDHPHNIFLKIAAENGLIAMVSFLLFLLSIFILVCSRFKKLSKAKKELMAILGVSALGAFAHSLIDYNFNFIANLLLIFVLLTFIRSVIVKNARKIVCTKISLVLGLLVGVICVYEGALFMLSETISSDFLRYSFYPRNYFLEETEEKLEEMKFDSAYRWVDVQTHVNVLDSQAYYLKGAVFCHEGNDWFDFTECKSNFGKALALNPMNDFVYYRDYLKLLISEDDKEEINELLKKLVPMMEKYFVYVQNNVHFTAYTQNVESAAETIDLMLPYLDDLDRDNFKLKKVEMIEMAEYLRATKTY